MALFTKLYILSALALAAMAVQIPIMERKSYSASGTYSPPDGEIMTCSVETNLIDHTGRATWFEPGLGNCGWTHNGNDKVLAISKQLYDQNNGGNCGQWLEIVNNQNGKRTWGQTVDSCPGCGYDDIDLSPALFRDLDNPDVGVLSVTWHFLPKFH